MSLTPRVIGLAQNGFDPLSIAHMLGITFQEVDEALRGISIPDPSGGEAGVGVKLSIYTNDFTGSTGFLLDPPNGYLGHAEEPEYFIHGGPTVVAPGGMVCEVGVSGSPLLLSPVNVHIFVTNLDGTQRISTYTPESIDLKEHAGGFVDLAGLLHYPPEKVGEDLELEHEKPGEHINERVYSTAGGVFFIKASVSLEPSR